MNRKVRNLALVLWMGAIASGTAFALRSEQERVGPELRDWVRNSALVLDRERPTLVLFLHADCPCTDAGQAALGRVLDSYPEAFHVAIVRVGPFTNSPNDPQPAAYVELLRHAGVEKYEDTDATLAAKFGVLRGGTLLAFSPSGDALFEGGLATEDGERRSGDALEENPGLDAIRDIARGRNPDRLHAPSYGCPFLLGPRPDGALVKVHRTKQGKHETMYAEHTL